jgi:hypothetical protein
MQEDKSIEVMNSAQMRSRQGLRCDNWVQKSNSKDLGAEKQPSHILLIDEHCLNAVLQRFNI